MTRKFNPPPNWPRPPAGWSPPASWHPDPAWGPAPVGWSLWVDEEPIAKPSEDSKPANQRVFISYRRSDCQPQANGLHDGLKHRLHAASIFMDIDSIPPGADFEEHIRSEIEICDLVLVLIGDNWLDAQPGSDLRRIDEENDFVRLEVESALASPRVRVIPVLVEGVQMPRSAEFPESIRRLARLNAFELSDKRWSSDLEKLAKLIEQIRREEEPRTQRIEVPESRPAPAEMLPGEPRENSAPVASRIGFTPPPDALRTPDLMAHTANVRAAPYPPRPSRDGRQVIAWVMVALPVVTCGLLAFVPALFAAYLRRDDRGFRWKMIGFAASVFASIIAGYVLLGTAPTDADGTPVGALSDLGAVMLLVGILASLGFALYQALTTKRQ